MMLTPPTQSPVLVIDDDKDMLWALSTIVRDAGLPVVEADAGPLGLQLASQIRPAAVLLDLRLPGLSGEEVLGRLRRLYQAVPVIVVTGHGSIPSAVDAIRAGAFDYLTKPFDNAVVVAAVTRAIAQEPAVPPENRRDLRQALTGLMGHGPAIEALIGQLDVVLNTDFSVLICGETGTGKEIVAQALHRHGPRTTRPFVVFDCGAIVEALVDAEFFGHERGAYTGANERRRGRFELAADGGTIFLDEIGNLCAVGQQALLRALEERVIYRVGGTTPIRLDTRVIAATNEQILDEEDASRFRPDLFYRLSEYTIMVPPLRTRPEDIAYLARRFLAQTRRAIGGPGLEITEDALDVLRGYAWPGNVRQLRNVVRRAGLVAPHKVTEAVIRDCMPRRPARIAVQLPQEPAADVPLRDLVQGRVQQLERDAIRAALTQAGGNKAAAARQLGIDYKTFRIKLKAIEQNGAMATGRLGG
jgi:two-component system nitrogen regulation response regulator GlnG